jgi:hypothetical protein
MNRRISTGVLKLRYGRRFSSGDDRTMSPPSAVTCALAVELAAMSRSRATRKRILIMANVAGGSMRAGAYRKRRRAGPGDCLYKNES